MYEWDVFISHASEDTNEVAVPLANELRRRGIRVWIDARELEIGDKLREKVGEGLTRSRFGVVVITPRSAAIMCGITWRATIQAPLRLMSSIESHASSVSSCASP